MRQGKISSGWTKPLLVIMTLLWVVFPIVLFAGDKFSLEGPRLLAALIAVVLIGITIYLALNLSEVVVAGDVILCKKIFGTQKKYTFDQIGLPSSFRFKRLKFTSVEMEDATGEVTKFLILNNDALLSGESIDAEDILTEIRSWHQLRNPK